MRVAVWHTGHEIADNVSTVIRLGLDSSDGWHTDFYDRCPIDQYDIHIGYGILRGMDDVFRVCWKAGKPFVHIDKGYWKPGHFDGYYRISLNGTQQTTGLDKLEPDYARWDKLGIEVLSPDTRLGYTIVCPPTLPVANFFDIVDDEQWKYEAVQDLIDENIKFFTRYKGDDHPIDWDNIGGVRIFNSSVGWEALRQGIPVVSDATHSILGVYDKLMDFGWQKDYAARRRFFAVQAGLQLTLDEMRQGKLWPLIQKLLSST